MKKKSLIILPVAALVLLGAVPALAHGNFMGGKNGQGSRGMHQPPLEPVAKVLGISAEELKTQLDQGKKIDDLLTAKGIDKEQFKKQMQDQHLSQMKEMLNKQVQEGKITQAQAEERLKEFQEKMQKGGMMKEHHLIKIGPEKIAGILGMTPQQLGEQMKQGKKLVDIAKEKGISEQDLKNKLAEIVKNELSAQVQKGTLTQAQADERLKDIQTKIEKGEFPGHPMKKMKHFMKGQKQGENQGERQMRRQLQQPSQPAA